jgi:putative transposase
VPSRTVPILAGLVYHVTNRTGPGRTLFDSRAAYRAFIELMAEALAFRPVRLLAFCIMPNHWHFVIWADTDDDVRRFVAWLSLTHATRFNRFMNTSGPVYPKRYEAIPVESGTNLYRLIRYVERNPCAAGLASRAAAWPWSSAAPRSRIPVAEWPVPRPSDWEEYVEIEIESDELKEIRRRLKEEPLRRLRRRKNDSADW